jgi:His/Glu/Gln/Arg/opine family amino acid ABC transporter permease subunit
MQEAREAPKISNWVHLRNFPWWIVIIIGIGITIFFSIVGDEIYQEAFSFIAPGVALTLQVTALSYLLALILGLLFSLMRLSSNPILYAIATLYVEIMRGLPMLVIILYAGFVIGPAIRDVGQDVVGNPDFDFPMLWRAIIGLALGYGAYLSEVFRGGIQSIGSGQMEAARSLGMTYMQSMRLVILPQAIRIILPPLGNNLIALLKDSSLISILALQDTLQLGRQFISRSFRAFEGYNTVAIIFLLMTLTLSLGVRWLETRMETRSR